MTLQVLCKLVQIKVGGVTCFLFLIKNSTLLLAVPKHGPLPQNNAKNLSIKFQKNPSKPSWVTTEEVNQALTSEELIYKFFLRSAFFLNDWWTQSTELFDTNLVIYQKSRTSLQKYVLDIVQIK